MPVPYSTIEETTSLDSTIAISSLGKKSPMAQPLSTAPAFNRTQWSVDASVSGADDAWSLRMMESDGSLADETSFGQFGSSLHAQRSDSLQAQYDSLLNMFSRPIKPLPRRAQVAMSKAVMEGRMPSTGFNPGNLGLRAPFMNRKLARPGSKLNATSVKSKGNSTEASSHTETSSVNMKSALSEANASLSLTSPENTQMSSTINPQPSLESPISTKSQAVPSSTSPSSPSPKSSNRPSRTSPEKEVKETVPKPPTMQSERQSTLQKASTRSLLTATHEALKKQQQRKQSSVPPPILSAEDFASSSVLEFDRETSKKKKRIGRDIAGSDDENDNALPFHDGYLQVGSRRRSATRASFADTPYAARKSRFRPLRTKTSRRLLSKASLGAASLDSIDATFKVPESNFDFWIENEASILFSKLVLSEYTGASYTYRQRMLPEPATFNNLNGPSDAWSTVSNASSQTTEDSGPVSAVYAHLPQPLWESQMLTKLRIENQRIVRAMNAVTYQPPVPAAQPASNRKAMVKAGGNTKSSKGKTEEHSPASRSGSHRTSARSLPPRRPPPLSKEPFEFNCIFCQMDILYGGGWKAARKKQLQRYRRRYSHRQRDYDETEDSADDSDYTADESVQPSRHYVDDTARTATQLPRLSDKFDEGHSVSEHSVPVTLPPIDDNSRAQSTSKTKSTPASTIKKLPATSAMERQIARRRGKNRPKKVPDDFEK